MFQFLIGTLKTGDVNDDYGYSYVFQFLIGTLKTTGYSGNPGWNTDVSIPHRYAENAAVSQVVFGPDLLFQFLIGTLKTLLFPKA